MSTTFQTRLSLKIDSLANWQTNGSKVLLAGEVGFITQKIDKGTKFGTIEPIRMIVGDGESTVTQLLAADAFYAKASDVLDACKSESALSAFIKSHSSVITGYVTKDEFDTLVARVAALEGRVTTLEGKVDGILDGTALDSFADVEAKFTSENAAITAAYKAADKTLEDSLTALVNAAKTQADKGVADAATAKTAADAAQKTANDATSQANTNKTDIAALAGRVTTAEGNITTNTGSIDSLKSELETLKNSVSSPMNFKGKLDSLPANTTGYVNGDVIAVGDKEYVCYETKWIELGDTTAEAARITTLEGYFNAGVAKNAEKATKDANGNTIATYYAAKSELDSAVANINKNATAISTEVTDRKAAITALEKTVSDGDSANNTKIEGVATRVTALETYKTSHTEEFNGLKAQVNTINEKTLDKIAENTSANYVIFDCGSSSVNI